MKKTILKALAVLALLLCSHAPSLAANSVYISQSGGGTGASCASPLAASYFNTSGNWSGTPTGFKIGPGTTVFLCGTSITTNLTFQGSGSAGGSSTCGGGSSAVACTPVILDGTNLTGMSASIFLGGSANYWIIQNITWVTNYAGSNHVIDLEGASNGTIQNNVCDSFNGNTTDSDIIWIGAASGFSTNIDIKNNILGYANVVTGFQSDVIATERSSFVTIEGNVDTNRSPNTCGSCHDDMIQTFCGNSCSSGQPPHDWTIRYNLFVMNTTVTTNKSCGIFEGMTGPLNIYGNLYEGLAGASGANCVVADGNAAGFVFNFYGNTIAEHSGGPNNLLNISGTGTFTVQDNIIYNTDAGNACTGGACAGMTRGGNLWFGPNIPSCSGVPTDLCGSNPLFTNFAGNDYSLQAGSPARSLGLNLSSSFTQYVLPEQTWPNPMLGTRPATGAWDSGYTQFSSGGGGTPAVTFAPVGGVGLGNTILNNPVLVVENIQNTGTATLNISGITVGGANAAMFTRYTSCGSTLIAGYTCEIAVKFIPTSTGAKSATVSIVDNAPGSPHTFTATGTGIAGTIPALDQYGGNPTKPCVNTTGRFHTEELGAQWTLCTPLGNSFYLLGVYVVSPFSTTAAITKYGSLAAWGNEANLRIQSWGFNSPYYKSLSQTQPFFTDPSFPVDGNGIHSIPTKMPFIFNFEPGLYGMENHVLTPTTGFPTGQLLPVNSNIKHMAWGWTPAYVTPGGYTPPDGEPDFFDPNMQVWLHNYLMTQIPGAHTQPYVDYVLGATADDSDELYGLGAGPDFPTNPPSDSEPNLGWLTATMSPLQSALAMYTVVYTNQTVYTKQAWANYLQGKYTTIAALNTSWHSAYTTFGSSGIKITGEAIGTGDGTTKTFTHTIANMTASRFTIQILVNGAVVGAEQGRNTFGGYNQNGNFYGYTASASPVSTLTGTMNYTTGAISITFVTAPASGAAITVNYIQNGWQFGSGILDEAAQASHLVSGGGWLTTDSIFLSGMNANIVADFNAFTTKMVQAYLQPIKVEMAAQLPGWLFFGPDGYGSAQSVPWAAVLQGIAGNQDLAIIGLGLTKDANYQPKMDFMYTNMGNMPLVTGTYFTANPDSPYASFPLVNTYPTQSARGLAYVQLLALHKSSFYTANGAFPFMGSNSFDYVDIPAQHANFGLITILDNAYDGNEATTGSVACSAPLATYTCGGEASTYGNYISCVTFANTGAGSCTGPGTGPAPSIGMFAKR